MKKVATFIIIVLFLTSFVFASTIQTFKAVENSSDSNKITFKAIDNSEDSGNGNTAGQERCTTTGGTWKEFSNGCRDSCRYARSPDILCTQAFTMGCDCGEDECWNGEECEDNEKEDEDDETDEEIKIRTRERIRTKSGLDVEIRREIIYEDGEKIIKIKRKTTDKDGNEREVEIKIKITDDGIKRHIKITSEDGELEIESELEVKESDDSSQIIITKANGEIVIMDILPDEAIEIARRRLRFRNRFRNMNMSNLSVSLDEIQHKNIPRVVYNIQANQHGKFLGIFKLAMRVEAQVDPETGEIIEAKRPWWAFLVAVSEDQTEEDETTSTQVCCAITPVVAPELEVDTTYELMGESACSIVDEEGNEIVGANYEIVEDSFCEQSQ